MGSAGTRSRLETGDWRLAIAARALGLVTGIEDVSTASRGSAGDVITSSSSSQEGGGVCEVGRSGEYGMGSSSLTVVNVVVADR